MRGTERRERTMEMDEENGTTEKKRGRKREKRDQKT
jgi:hypothetical protein